jgi:hypothetical protein
MKQKEDWKKIKNTAVINSYLLQLIELEHLCAVN